jgi:hypothetical protein
MTFIRWAATTTLAIAFFAPGCQSKQPETTPTESMAPTPDRVAAARERYLKAGYPQVGVTEAVSDSLAAVSGIEGKDVKKGQAYHFIDIDTNQSVNLGSLKEVGPSGHPIFEFLSVGDRAPRPGDLVVPSGDSLPRP